MRLISDQPDDDTKQAMAEVLEYEPIDVGELTSELQKEGVLATPPRPISILFRYFRSSKKVEWRLPINGNRGAVRPRNSIKWQPSKMRIRDMLEIVEAGEMGMQEFKPEVGCG